MVIFDALNRKGYEIIRGLTSDEYEVFYRLDGSSRLADWKSIRVKRVRADGDRACRPADLPWFLSGVLVMRRSAVDALRDMLDAHGELLPLETEDGIELYAFNVRAIDALDKERSSLVYFPDGEKIMDIRKHVFIPSTIQGVDMFRLPMRGSSIYLSERFVERVQAAKLTGLTFSEVWSSG